MDIVSLQDDFVNEVVKQWSERKPSYVVIQESFDDLDSLKVINAFPLAVSTNSVILKGGFETIEAAEVWKELYRKDPSIWKPDINDTLKGLELLNELNIKIKK